MNTFSGKFGFVSTLWPRMILHCCINFYGFNLHRLIACFTFAIVLLPQNKVNPNMKFIVEFILSSLLPIKND